jgi:hypothetical protein
MKPSDTPFTVIYAQWLQSFRAMFPGGKPSDPSSQVTLPPKPQKAGQAAAVQEWEDEGGSVKPVPAPEAKEAPKIPL